ncbi:MAG: phosphotransferase [Kordiimonadaceae bacterium]|nr:phosphotransferase [Kordiimonadaceae bacterium]
MSKMSRANEIKSFLISAGWGTAKIKSLAGDASFRRYDRINKGKQVAILMDAPPDFENTRPFVALAEHLRSIGLGAPKVYARDYEAGLLLLEDLGDDLLKRVLDREPNKEKLLYQKAVDELVKINNAPLTYHLSYGEGTHCLQVYDMEMLLSEALLIADWYYPANTNKRLTFSKREEFIQICSKVLTAVAGARDCLTLRDYHAENLLENENGSLGLIDFQDAVIGNSAYDLVSLLQDARRDVCPDIELEMVEYFCNKIDKDIAEFKEHYTILGAQRNMKIIGIFARLYLRDGKNHYIKLIPRVWGLLERCLKHPALSELKIWLDKEIPNRRNEIFDPNPLKPSQAMVLAAGLGKRMAPLTDNIPKPLIKINGKMMLAQTLDCLTEAAVTTAIINKHHFAGQIDQFVIDRKDWRPKITLSDETNGLLDSGGAVKKVLPLMGNEPFYILNSDMIWKDKGQGALNRLATEWRDDMDVLLLLVKRSEANGHDGAGDFNMDNDGRLTFRNENTFSDYFYGGIHIIRPTCFDSIKENKFSLRKVFRQTEATGRLFGLLHNGSWYHVGTPVSVHETEKLLKGK